MTNISGEKYLLRTEKVTKKIQNIIWHLHLWAFLFIYLFILKDCICQQHIVASTGAGDFNKVPHLHKSYFNNFISSFTCLPPSLKLMLQFSSAWVGKMGSSRV